MVNSLRWRIRPSSQRLTRSWHYNQLSQCEKRHVDRALENLMQRESEYGPRLTDEEYEKRIISLYRDLPPLPSPDQDREVRRQELNLAIDHRLGRDFPEERRSALWTAQQR